MVLSALCLGLRTRWRFGLVGIDTSRFSFFALPSIYGLMEVAGLFAMSR